MAVIRIVPDLPVADVGRSNALYAGLFDLRIGTELGWFGNIASPDSYPVQLQVMTADQTAPCNPRVSVGMNTPDEVDAVHARVVAAGLEIVHPPTDEPWGVHRFFFRDPDGNVINVVAHT